MSRYLLSSQMAFGAMALLTPVSAFAALAPSLLVLCRVKHNGQM